MKPDPNRNSEREPGASPRKLASSSHVARLFAARAASVVRVDQPLVLIAQPTRSGGTLLSQLLDGHRELHVHPYELEIGYPEKNVWPALDPRDTPKHWFSQLQEPHVAHAFGRGYTKDRPAEKLGYVEQQETFPLLLVPSFQRALFAELAAALIDPTPRSILSCYLTSYFNAWIDNQNLYATPKRWVVGFRSGLGSGPNLAAFFADYPDGRHVTCVREAKGWVASRMRLWGEKTGKSVHEYAQLWMKFARQRFDAVERYRDRVFVCTFERLIADTPVVMSALARWLGIAFDPILTIPTFNGFPIKANSSFRVVNHGVLAGAREHWRQVLSADDAAMIDALTGPLYAEAAQLADAQLRVAD